MAKFKLKLQLVPTDDMLTAATPEAKTAAAKALSRQLRITAVTLLLTLGMIIAVTVAWFAMNRKVDSSGMEMQIDSSTPNLLIAKYDEAFATGVKSISFSSATDPEYYTTDSNSQTVSLSLAPAQHFSDSRETGYTGLRYNTNSSEVDMTTGLKSGSVNLDFDPVPVYTSGTRYYLDYTVKLGCEGNALEATSLTATFSATAPADFATVTATAAKEHLLAASVDIYLSASSTDIVAPGNYKGTLNLANKDYTNSDPTVATTTSVPLLSPAVGDNTVTIPMTTAPLYVTMRFYFDGGLLKDATHAYVHSASITAQQLAMKVEFNAPAYVPPESGSGD